MKKLAIIINMFIFFSSYAVEISHTVVLEDTEPAHRFKVVDLDFPPFYYDPITDTYPEDGYSYMWYTDEGHVSNEMEPVFFFSSSGSHNVSLVLTPRKKGDDVLKVFHTFNLTVSPLQTSSLSNGDIIHTNMYVDGQARMGDRIYVVVPLNSCKKIPSYHNYKVGYNQSQLEFISVLSQSNLGGVELSSLPDIALDITLDKAVNFTYYWNEFRNDVATILEFKVLTDSYEPIGLKFHKYIVAQCDEDVEITINPIRGPYDPNYKESDISEVNVAEYPIKKITPTEVLYTIHFQNIGNAPVDSITIFDNLPNYLNFVSFEGSSEPGPLVTASHSGGILKWIIAPNADIKGTNESPTQPESSTKGWVQFKAEIVKEENIIYDSCHCLRNYATIYFDSLTPINTEANLIVIGDSLCFGLNPNSQGLTYAETICNKQGTGSSFKTNTTSENGTKSYLIYPNPFNSVFYLDGPIKDIQSIEVINSIGQRILSQSRYDGLINLDSHPNGLYFVLIKTEEKQHTIQVNKY